MQKYATYFFLTDAFNKLPYGATSNKRLMTEAAEIVVEGHTFTKHHLALMGQEVSSDQLRVMKDSWNGMVVSAPCL